MAPGAPAARHSSGRTDATKAAVIEESIKREQRCAGPDHCLRSRSTAGCRLRSHVAARATRVRASARALFKFLREQDALQPAALPEPACEQGKQCAADAQQEACSSSGEAAGAAAGTQGPAYALSRHLWASVNPGYILPAGRPQCSTQRADYAWDADEARPGIALAHTCAASSARQHPCMFTEPSRP